MCGITGFCDFTKTQQEFVLREMTDSISHRGPDSGGVKIIDAISARLGFGHRRLSILDLSPQANQPMSKDGLTIVFNGEIYNFDEIRKELLGKGHSFQSNSDTEVIIEAYRQWGMTSISRFRGMFAYALFDDSQQKLFLVRDRVGVKPLYVYNDENLILFGSELKSLCENPGFSRELDIDALAQYLKLSYVPTPYSIFKNTRKVKPGHYLELDLESGKLKDVQYWSVIEAYNSPILNISYSEAIDELEQKMISSFNYRMVADVPVGVFLSGGYDSTAVAALLQKNRTEKIKTFTIGFKEAKYNEAQYAKEIANYLGTDHTELYCTPTDATDIIDNLPDIFDEPFADNSVVPTVLVSQLAKKSVTVALSGDGGDEIFAGYDKFKRSIRLTDSIPNVIQKLLATSMGMVSPEKIPYLSSSYNFPTRYHKMKDIWKSHSPYKALRSISEYFTEKETRLLLLENYVDLPTYFEAGQDLTRKGDTLNKLLAVDYLTFLMDNNLTKIDRASMSVSLEGREPFLDQNIIEFVARLPGDFKLRNGRNKAILKDVVHKYVDQRLLDRPKMPFLAPLEIWFKKEMRGMLLDFINEETISRQGLFHVAEAIRLRDEYLQGNHVNHRKIWNILVFQIWHHRYMN